MKRKSERTVLEIAQAALVRSEHVEQSFLIQRLELAAARWPELELLYAVPNGGLRSKAQAGKLKAEGVKRSVPDLVLPVPRWPFHGLYVEMKKMGEHSTPAQREFQRRLSEQGYAVVECQGEEAGFTVFMGYLSIKPFGMLPVPTWGSHPVERIRLLRLLAGAGLGSTIRGPELP